MMPLLMFVALMAAIFMGFPVAFSLMAVALVFGVARFGEVAVFQFVSKVDDVANANVLAAVPLFIFMGRAGWPWQRCCSASCSRRQAG